jgi:hypothetical protein
LYDAFGNVAGFVEIKLRGTFASIKVRHNLPETQDAGFLLSISADGAQSSVYALRGAQTVIENHGRVDLDKEVLALIIKRNGAETETLASGIINATQRTRDEIRVIREATREPDIANKIEAQPVVLHEPVEPVKNEPIFVEPVQCVKASLREATREIDDMLRMAVDVSDAEACQCESCPYRDYFYQFTLDRDVIAEGSRAATTTQAFFDLIKNQIQNILDTKPEFEFLTKSIKNSRFVHLSDQNAIGVIFDPEGIPQYLCSATHSEQRGDVPGNIKGFAQWLPSKAHEPNSEGYWLSYQAAKTGEQIKIV